MFHNEGSSVYRDGDSRPAWAIRLQAERESRGWSKREMARRLLRTPQYRNYDHGCILRQIYRWENGEVFPRRAQTAFAVAFGIHEDHFSSNVAKSNSALIRAKQEALIIRAAYREALRAVGLPEDLRVEIDRYVALDIMSREPRSERGVPSRGEPGGHTGEATPQGFAG